jgi:hypothetical protein
MRIWSSACLALLLGATVSHAQETIPACDPALSQAVDREIREAPDAAGQEPLLILMVSRSAETGEELTTACLPTYENDARGAGLQGSAEDLVDEPTKGGLGTAVLKPITRPAALSAGAQTAEDDTQLRAFGTQSDCYTYVFKKKQYKVCP